ncbi:hypothetical protein R3X27_15475 [Tropicimonas sp. TH_r6]|uniref:hypothetical protein n=1 Tax=Tropicimonas sp. TH_r6 TaxID=3082085 RepID=UPI002952FABE|nr:hypothetical protein [Tropicimonas sp. TH_r6]MDV7144088.1 hypothetical protein [Tropicimonas sp. TH_r6]
MKSAPLTAIAKRPEAEARKVGLKARSRFNRQLRSVLMKSLGWPVYSARMDKWEAEHWANGRPQRWASMRVRPEVAVAVGELQANYLARNDKEVSQADVLSALVAASLPELLHREEFAPAR